MCDLPEAQPVRDGKQKSRCSNNAQTEPDCLIDIWLLCNTVHDSIRIPYSVAIAGPHVKRMGADGNVCIHSGKRAVRIKPNWISSVHAVLESDFFGQFQRNGIKVNFSVMRTGWQNQLPAGNLL